MEPTDERIRPTKIQAAILRAAQTASERIGTPNIVTERLFSRIVRHQFREPRVLGAIEQLRRMKYVSRAENDRLQLHVPDCAWQGTLTGDDPEPMSDAQLFSILTQTGHDPSPEPVKPSPEPRDELPRQQNRNATKAGRRFILLANHRLAETWYGGALPSRLSHDIIVTDRHNEASLLALRSALTQQRMMESFPEPTGRHEYQWRVTARGISYCERSGTVPTVTLERIATIATSLGIVPR